MGFIPQAGVSCCPSYLPVVCEDLFEATVSPIIWSLSSMAFGSLGEFLRKSSLNIEIQVATTKRPESVRHFNMAWLTDAGLPNSHQPGSPLQNHTVVKFQNPIAWHTRPLNCQFQNQTPLLNTKNENLVS